MPNQFLSDEFGDIEDYFVTDYWLIDNFVGDTLWGWGAKNDGRLGINDAGNGAVNDQVTTFAGGTNWKQVSSGPRYSTGIKTDGTLWVWGNNEFVQLGTNDNNTITRYTPVTTFAGGNNWKQVSSLGYHTAAIKTDGSLWIWGNGGSGVLGNNNTTNRSTPVTTFTGGNNWKSVSATGGHTLAIKTDGSLWGWGNFDGGRLGNGENNGSSVVPITIFGGGSGWKSVSAAYPSAAIKADGSLWTWGQNEFGQLGINASGNRNTPVTTFAGGNNWKQVAVGGGHITAIKTDGSLWTWGYNNNGQLGINASGNRTTPVTTFAGGNNWKSVFAGDQHTAAIKTDGTLWVWGKNGYRQLGDKTDINRSTPVTTFVGGNNWKSVASGQSHTMAVKSGLNVDLS